MKKTFLEKSTNTHFTKNNVEVVKEFIKMNTIILKPQGNMIVEHGHHNTVSTQKDTKQVIKITQQEYNPLLKVFQNSFD